MLMAGGNSYMGSFEFDTGSHHLPFVQHQFQEEFLRSFYEDEEFRHQVLRCLLSRTQVDSIIPMRIERKPRRTWLKDLECTTAFSAGDDEAGNSYCSDEKAVLTSEPVSCRDAFSQFPERRCIGTGSIGGPLWSFAYDVPSGREALLVDAECQFPQPVELSCYNMFIGTASADLHAPEGQWRVARSSQLDEAEGASRLGRWEEENYGLGPRLAFVSKPEKDKVQDVAAWLLSGQDETVATTRKRTFSTLPRSPKYIFTSNPLACLDWEEFPDLGELPRKRKPALALPLTPAFMCNGGILSRSSLEGETDGEESLGQESNNPLSVENIDKLSPSSGGGSRFPAIIHGETGEGRLSGETIRDPLSIYGERGEEQSSDEKLQPSSKVDEERRGKQSPDHKSRNPSTPQEEERERETSDQKCRISSSSEIEKREKQLQGPRSPTSSSAQGGRGTHSGLKIQLPLSMEGEKRGEQSDVKTQTEISVQEETREVPPPEGRSSTVYTQGKNRGKRSDDQRGTEVCEEEETTEDDSPRAVHDSGSCLWNHLSSRLSQMRVRIHFSQVKSGRSWADGKSRPSLLDCQPPRAARVLTGCSKLYNV
ncbi:hypothetical protein R1flu_001540 [Riccia fluitans]|uniref:Uncharacterized protein n=1 Tax=Riccia fluitans TaxID=41844 RepID=A0ABD1Y412_9MARC